MNLMIYTEFINYIQIAEIIKNPGITKKEFSDHFHLSRHQLKKDLLIIEEMMPYYGMRLSVSRNALFYRIIEEDLSKLPLSIFNTLYFRHSFNYVHHRNMIIDLILSWKLLSSKKPVSSTDLAGYVGYSRSGIRDSLAWARENFSIYNLQCISIPHYGLSVNGNEFYKRFCLLSLNNMITPRIIIGLPEELINNDQSPQLTEKITDVRAYLSSQRKIAISYINQRLISNYLVVSYNRIMNGFTVTEPVSQLAFDKHRQEYVAAEHIFKEILGFIEISRHEIFALASILLIYNEQEDMDSLKSSSSLVLEKEEKSFRLLTDFLKKEYGLDLGSSSLAPYLHHCIFALVLKNEMKMTNFRALSLSGKSYVESAKPLMRLIQNDMKDLFENCYQTKLQHSALVDLIELISKYVDTLPISFDKKEICVVINRSIDAAKLNMLRIDSLYDHSFYDHIGLVGDPKEIDYETEEKIYVTHYFTGYKKYRNIFVLDKHNNDLVELFPYILSKGLLAPSFFEEIKAEKISGSAAIRKLNRQINETAILYEDMAFVIDVHSKKKRKLHLYETSEPIRVLNHKNSDFNNRMVSKVIFLSFDISDGNIRYYDHILNLFTTKKSLFSYLLENPDTETLSAYLDPHIFKVSNSAN